MPVGKEMLNSDSLWYPNMMGWCLGGNLTSLYLKTEAFPCFFPNLQQGHTATHKTIFVLCDNQIDVQEKLDAQITKKW